MSKPGTSIPLFMQGNMLCNAVNEAGEVSFAKCGVHLPPPVDVDLPPGSFAVGINREICDVAADIIWDEEWDDLEGNVAYFEPVREGLRVGEIYLYGEWDAEKDHLRCGRVQELVALIPDRGVERAMFRADGEIELDYAPALSELRLVGHLVHPKPRLEAAMPAVAETDLEYDTEEVPAARVTGNGSELRVLRAA